MTTQSGVKPIEDVLAALRAALEERDLAKFALADRIKDAFPDEQTRVRLAEEAVTKYEGQLTEAVGAFGALPAEAKSAVGWAHYSAATKRVYAPAVEWRAALTRAGMEQYISSILDETVNPTSVAALTKLSADFHKATEGLITEKQSKPVLRYGFAHGKE